MITRKIVDQVKHKNGNISYRATRAILAKSHAHLYPARRINENGEQWIYVGVCGKWNNKGKQQWVINYNQQGEIIR